MNMIYLGNGVYNVTSYKDDNSVYTIDLKDKPEGSCTCPNFYFQKKMIHIYIYV